MIKMLVPLPIGNAVKVLLSPPQGAVLSRVLRAEGNYQFSGVDDPNAVVVYQGDGNYAVDAAGLQNGTPYTYGDFSFDGSEWSAGSAAPVTPLAAYADTSTDVLSVLVSRFEAGLQNEIANGALLPPAGVIDVLNAPPAFEETSWPVVTVHVTNDGSAERGIGEQLDADSFDVIGNVWDETHGWIARAHLTVIGWSKNPDERIALRKSLRRLVIGNLPVFQGFGMTRIDFSQTDAEDMGSYPVPVYQTVGTFTCYAPAVVGTTADSITEVSSSLTPEFGVASDSTSFQTHQ
jgi:hypothetical protein